MAHPQITRMFVRRTVLGATAVAGVLTLGAGALVAGAAPASYNGTIAPGGNTSLGFQGTWTNSDAMPTAFTVNGTACTT